MKKQFTLISLGIVVTALLFQSSGNYVHGDQNGAPAGNTGSPADGKTCARSGCHASSAAQPTTVPIMSSNIPATGYIPGTQYTITASVANSNSNISGFEISPQGPTGIMKGSMICTDTYKTKIISTKYITHTMNGRLGTAGSSVWSFDWIAPVAGTGAVNFYGAFNYSNGLANASGDQIRTEVYTVNENTTVGVNEIPQQVTSRLFPNPVNDLATFEFELNSAASVSICFLDATGRVIKSMESFEGKSGMQSVQLEIPSDWAPGIYKVVMRAGNQQAVRNFIKQ